MSTEDRVRLQKAISAAGLMSRRAAEELIAAGRVSIGARKAILGDRVDPATEVVTIDGKPIPVAPALVTYLLYKPLGVISTADDTHGRTTVVDLVPSEPRVWPVGRLDAESEGLVLLSNDGFLTNLVTHPRFGISKTYQVIFDRNPGVAQLKTLVSGLELDDGPAAAISVRLLDRLGDRALVEMVMGEGRNREIRRMGEAIGHPVSGLVRVAIGPLADRQLQPGTYRQLEVEELTALYGAADPAGLEGG